ncbi:MAG: amino acid ABC transporter substrate-binding protein, partial [Flavobacterium sp.]
MNLRNGYFILVFFILILGACSPKIRTPKTETTKPVEKEKPADKK